MTFFSMEEIKDIVKLSRRQPYIRQAIWDNLDTEMTELIGKEWIEKDTYSLSTADIEILLNVIIALKKKIKKTQKQGGDD